MRVREQLTEQVVAIRARWALTPPPAMARVEEVTLECRPAVPPMAALYAARGRVNASAVGGAGAGYLLVRAVATEPIVADSGTAFRVVVRIAYRERPWVGVAADLDALLEALEAGAGAGRPERAETWRDLPGML